MFSTMKNAIYAFQSLILLIISGCLFISCEDDKDEPSAGTSRKLLSITTIGDSYTNIEFANPKWSNGRLVSFQQGNDADDVYSINFSGSNAAISYGTGHEPTLVALNNDGYAVSASFGYEFTYNSAGQMTYWKSTSSSTSSQYCDISYDSNGDISKLEYYISSYDGKKTAIFAYTDSNISTPIPNKGGIMLMSDWNMMWDWEYYYWFGIYGKAIAHLPVKVGDSTFSWTLDGDGYPIECVVVKKDNGYYPTTYTKTYKFTWE